MDIKATVEVQKSVEVFCCYARKDQPLLEEFKKQLMALKREGLITLWADTDINAGAEWEKEIHLHLNTSHIILLLVSPDFMASEYCYSTEMVQAMKRHESGQAQVIPIILRPVEWQQAPFAKLQALPRNAHPIISSKWPYQDEGFADAARGVREAVVAYLAKEERRRQKEETKQAHLDEEASVQPLAVPKVSTPVPPAHEPEEQLEAIPEKRASRLSLPAPQGEDDAVNVSLFPHSYGEEEIAEAKEGNGSKTFELLPEPLPLLAVSVDTVFSLIHTPSKTVEARDVTTNLNWLPQLWRHALLRWSVHALANEYPAEMFPLLLQLGCETEAFGYAELLTHPYHKAKALLEMARHLLEQPKRASEGTQLLQRFLEIAASLQVSFEEKQVLKAVLKILITQQQWEQAEKIVASFPENNETLTILAHAYIQTGSWHEAQRKIEAITRENRRTDLQLELVQKLADTSHWEWAEGIVDAMLSCTQKVKAWCHMATALTSSWQQGEEGKYRIFPASSLSLKEQMTSLHIRFFVTSQRWEQAQVSTPTYF